MRTLLIVFCLLLPVALLAADTVEPFDVGATDLELYSVLDGVGRPAGHQSVGGEMVVGWGLAPGFSSYIATAMAADGMLADGEASWAVGAFGTVRDGGRVDLDLMLDLSTSGRDGDPLCVCTGLELNLDGAGRGLYLRGNVSLAGERTDQAVTRTTDYGLLLGGYLDLAPGRQLLLEVDAVRADGAGGWEAGAVAVGLNTELASTLELISQVAVTVPTDGERTAVNAMLGFIATLPGGMGR